MISTRFRLFGKGHGEQVPCDLAVGETILPIADAVMFNPSGGQAIVGTTPDGAQSEVLTYAGVSADAGKITTAGGVTQSPAALTATANNATNGVLVGTFGYKVNFVGTNGASEVSASASASPSAVSTPGAIGGFTSGAAAGGLVANGNYAWVVTYVTADGTETVKSSAMTVNGIGTTTTSADLTSIPTSGDTRVVSRRIYRTRGGVSTAAPYFLTATIGDNTATTCSDLTADASLGAQPPASNTTGGKASLTNIPLGPATTTSRNLWRTRAGGSDYFLLGALGDNVSTTFTDNTPDSSLGEAAPTTSRWTTVAGSTALPVADLSQFSEGQGWVLVGSQVVRFTGRSAVSGAGRLTGILTSGIGALVADVVAGSVVTGASALKGINQSNGLRLAMAKGSAVHLWVERNDLASQALYGIHEHLISDERMGEALLTATCDADLALFKDPIVTIRYETRDPKTRSGKMIHVDLPPPVDIHGDFLIQEVTITFDGPNTMPRYSVVASSVRFSFEDMLRRVLLAS